MFHVKVDDLKRLLIWRTRSFVSKRLEKWAAESRNVLTESQVMALKEMKEEKKLGGEIES